MALGLKACPLCFYQRSFMMALVAMLVIGLLTGMQRDARLGLLAVPLAVAGLGVALFHVYLEANGTLECPSGLSGWGSAPQQSLAAFGVLLLLLLLNVWGSPAVPLKRTVLAGGLVLGGLLAAGSCISNPPLPAPPTGPYQSPPDICRRPYVPPT